MVQHLKGKYSKSNVHHLKDGQALYYLNRTSQIN